MENNMYWYQPGSTNTLSIATWNFTDRLNKESYIEQQEEECENKHCMSQLYALYHL
jgi:hypothetical protein